MPHWEDSNFLSVPCRCGASRFVAWHGSENYPPFRSEFGGPHPRPLWAPCQSRRGFCASPATAAARTAFLPWPSREVEVHHHRRMVAACRYALLVEVLDVPHDPMAADPDRIEATSRARRVLPPPTNQSTGQIVFANMQGGQFSGWGQATTPLSSDYLVKDAVDLFNNGHADVIVLQQSTGATYYAEEGANGFLQWGSVTSSLGPHWQAV
jgi:hypothetical protein